MTRVIERGPNYHNHCFNLGRVFEQFVEIEEAITCYTQAIELNADLTPACLKRGLLYSLTEKIENSISDFMTVLGYDPNNIVALTNVGWLKLGLSRRRESRTIFETGKRHLRQAIELLERAIQHKPTAGAFTELGTIYNVLGQHERAALVPGESTRPRTKAGKGIPSPVARLPSPGGRAACNGNLS